MSTLIVIKAKNMLPNYSFELYPNIYNHHLFFIMVLVVLNCAVRRKYEFHNTVNNITDFKNTVKCLVKYEI
jgi:hypothetical protein